MKIGDHINSLNFANDLAKVDEMLSKAQSRVSFWGKREIKIDGYEGSFLLDDLAKSILSAEKKRSDACDLTPQERVAGINIMHKLRFFYATTDDCICRINLLTRFLVFMQEFTCVPFTTRFFIEDDVAAFRKYKKEVFIREFGNERNSEYILNQQLVAKEKNIREKAAQTA